MSKFVYISRGLLSYVNASFGLCQGLVDDGHQVVYLSADATIEPLVNQQGFEFVHLKSDAEFLEQSAAVPPPAKGNPADWLRWVREKRAVRAASQRNEEIAVVLREQAPDLVILDVECHFAIQCAVQAGFRVVLSSILFNLYRTGGVPPLNSTLVPATTMRDRCRIQMAWWRLRVESALLRIKQRVGRAALRAWLKPVRYHTVSDADLRSVARETKFLLSQQVARSHFLRPFAYTRLPLVYMCPSELEFPYALNEHTAYLGSTVMLNRADTVDKHDDYERWSAYLARRRNSSTVRPLIYCSLGSYVETDLAFLSRVLTVFERRTEWDLVLGLGSKSEPKALGTAPPNVLVLAWAPQLDVLHHADAAISHCGTSTILECICMGTPIVAYSTQVLDQDGNAARVGFHRLGIVGDVKSDSSQTIEDIISRVLTDTAIRSNVRAMRARWKTQSPHRNLINFANRQHDIQL